MAQKDVKLSLIEVFFSSLMIGAGEVFFGAFALSKGMGELLAGLVVGLPMMMGAGLQSFTPFLFERFGRPKRWVVLVAAAQAGVLLLLLGTCFRIETGAWTVFFLIGLYWACSFAGGSIWNYWMGFLIPEEGRSGFFARRARLTQYGIMGGLLISGALLHQAESQDWGPRAYALPFFIAFLARAVSAGLLFKQSPLSYTPKALRDSWAEALMFFREMRGVFRVNPNARRDLTFLFVFNASIYISSSFVAPFLLAKLNFDAMSFMAAQIALYLGRIASLSRARVWIDRHGLRRVLFWGALGISPLPALWFFVHHTWDAIWLQAVSGFFWGLFEVSVNLLLFAELPHKDKIQLLTWNNFFQTTAILVGTLIGGQIIASSGESLMGYGILFAVGALLRTALVLMQRPKILGKASQSPIQ